MRKKLLAAAAVVTAAGCLTLTACNDDDAKGGGNRPSQSATAKPATSPGTARPTAPSGPATPTAPGSPKGAALAFGEPSRTVGAGTVGILEITPTTVVYAGAAGRVTPQHGTFAVVTLLEKSLSANPADEEAPAAGGGWRWIAADGQSVPAGNGNAAKAVLAKYRHSGGIAPGTSQMRAKVFDLTPAQARGGTLVYTDGTKSDDRWKVPAVDTGPQIAEVKQQLKP